MKQGDRIGDQRGGIFAKLIALIVVVLFFSLIFLVRVPLLRLAGGYWVVGAPPDNCDAIIVLSNDDYTADRASRAAELYHAGWAPRIVASGMWLRPYFSIAQLMQHDLELRGVPAKAIIPFPHEAPDTLEEIKDLKGFIIGHGWRSVMVVTSNYHTRRTRYICRHIFKGAFRYRVVAAPDVHYDPDSWWRTREGLKLFLHESVGMMVAIWEVHHQAKEKSGANTSAEAGPARFGILLFLAFTPERAVYYSSCASVIA